MVMPRIGVWFQIVAFPINTRKRRNSDPWLDDKNRGDERRSYYNFFRPPRYHAPKDFPLSNIVKVWDFTYD